MPKGEEGLQANIDALLQLFERWLLPFNASKCKVMHLGHQNTIIKNNLGGTLLEATVEEKDLGNIVGSPPHDLPQADCCSNFGGLPDAGSCVAFFC